MDIDDLRSKWNSIEIPEERVGENTRDILSKMKAGKVNTLRDRYSSLSRGLVIVCVGGIFVSIPYLSATPTLGVLMICFFVLLGAIHMQTLWRVRRLRFSDMTIRDAMKEVCLLESNRIRKRTLGISLGLPLVFYMSMTLWDRYGDYVLYGCLAGAILGIATGLIINRRANEILRDMKSQLRDSD